MRYLLYSFLCIILSGKLSAQTTAFIPDPAFRSLLVGNYPGLMDGNQELIIANAGLMTGELYCGNASITNLEGIQHFVNITKLSCFQNKLSTLPDLSKLTKLIDLECFENQLTSLPPLNGLSKLQIINVSRNKLTTLPALNQLNQLIDLMVFNNQLSSIPDLTSLSSLQRFYCFENRLTSIGKMPASLKEFSFGDNQMTSVPDISLATGLTMLAGYTNRLITTPDMSPYSALTELNLGTNFLTTVPVGLTSLSQLRTLTLDNNKLTALPDLSTLTLLATCDLHGNYFTFEDLQPSAANPNAAIWKFCPQDSVQAPAYTGVLEGQTLTVNIAADDGVPNLTFSWYCNGTLLTQTNQPELTIPSVSKAHTGTWYCQIQSSIPSLSTCILSSHIFTIVVRTDFTIDKELTLTPNGDGKNDEWFFEEHGQLKVYNSAGVLLDQQTAPCYWSGMTSSGSILKTGYYIIQINDEATYQMTIIR